MKPIQLRIARLFSGLSMLVATLTAPLLATAEEYFARPDYRNTVYNGSPSIPGASVTNPASVAVFNGNVGSAGSTNTPFDGAFYLVRSVIGQPVGGIDARISGERTYKIGESIIPAIALNVNGTNAPASIEPSNAAYFVPGLNQVVAAAPGFVTIQWIRNDGSTNSPVRYFVESQPVRDPVALYHTHASGGSLSNDFGRLTWVPKVEAPAGLQVEILYNSQLPGPTNLQFNVVARDFRALNNQGLVVLVLRNVSGGFIDVEVVDVRANLPSGGATLADIGFPLSPYVTKPNMVKPWVSSGLNQQTPAAAFVYQHPVVGSPQFGEVYAVQRTTVSTNIEVYWRRAGVGGVEWPYELHQYTADWPTDTAKYQRYVRGSNAVKGPDVEIPPTLNGELWPFQEPSGHANDVIGNRFSTTAAGWSLLKYAPSNAVVFQVVRSVLHNDALQFNLTAVNTNIGSEILEPLHAGPRAGYIHVPEGNRYDLEIYDGQAANHLGWSNAWTTKQIFPVNTGSLEVWWSNLRHDVQWPSLVKRYNAVWPSTPERIVIASQRGTGPIDSSVHRDFRIYFQNDPTKSGFNPNDEHAFEFNAFGEQQGASQAVFALRNDLGTPTTSLPYVLLKSRNPVANLKWRFRVFEVLTEGQWADGTNYVFNYPITIYGPGGNKVEAPYPLSRLHFLERCDENQGVSGPYWRDRTKDFWPRAAGPSGGTDLITMRYFYSTNVIPGFYFPTAKPAGTNANGHVAWLDRRPGGVFGVPVNTDYTVSWPASVPELKVGETLAKTKFGLPTIWDQTSVEIIYQQSSVLSGQESVVLIDPTRERQVPLAQLPPDVANASESGKYYFTPLPPQLRKRIWWDPVEHVLKLKGELIEPVGGEYFLFLNVISQRERQVLLSLSQDGAFNAALTTLCNLSSNAIPVPPNTPFDHIALSAGLGKGVGYVTLAFNNSTNLNQPSDPISVHVIRVANDLYTGELKVIPSDNPFDEKLTLRHSGDYSGKADEYQFEWRTLPPFNGGPSPLPPAQWQGYAPQPINGFGANDVTIAGSGIYTLSDNWFICRYRPLNPSNPVGTNTWSRWTQPMLAEGWIKRVLAGINPFDQRFKSFENNKVNTVVSMLSQAGPRSSGATPLNSSGANNYGLLEIYETVLKRGIGLSIAGAPPLDYGPANDSLILVASRISKLYALLGNEAYADATDPTIAYGTESGQYGAEASTIHCFQNQLPTLLDEELALLRGRDDSQLPSVRTTPFYNRLIWNFTQGDGEVAYVANYGITDKTGPDGTPNGVIDEADAKSLYPQGHGDAWGHYLTALKSQYLLLRNTNFTWIPRSEAVIVGGVPVSVDYQDERQFATVAAARAKTGAEIVSMTYRSAYVEDPAGQWQGYQDSNTNRAWGVSEWASRAGMGAYFDWVMGNALLPDSYRQSHQITDATLSQLESVARYDLSDEIITSSNGIPAIVSLTSQQATNLLNIPGRLFVGRQSILAALDTALGLEDRLKLQTVILSKAQTSGIPEQVFFALDLLKGNQYASETALTNTLVSAIGTEALQQHYASSIRPNLSFPSGITPTGLQKIDRSTVPELREIAAAYVNVQEELDKADSGLNPLGLVKNALPFDINPREVDEGTTHFEQLYGRAVKAMNNAISVFNYANNSSQNLRRQSDSVQEFSRTVAEREADFNSRLIEIFGYPYSDDIGPTGSYASGYNGPDLYHYMYEDSSRLLGIPTPTTYEFVVTNRDLTVTADGAIIASNKVIKYHVAANGFGIVKPTSWVGQRRAPGEIQLSHLDLLQAKARFERAMLEYENLISQIEDQANLLEAQYNVNADEIQLLNSGQGVQESLNAAIRRSRERQLNYQTKARIAGLIANAWAEGLPKELGFIAGMANGAIFDPSFGARNAILMAGSVITEMMTQNANRESLVEQDHQQAKELAQSQQNIALTTLRQDQAIQQQIAQLEQLVRQEAPLRLEIYNLQEALQQTAGRYSSALARGHRLLEDRLRFRQQTAERVQSYRYNDMAFRIFRNDALQKYRAQFDLAAQYVYLAAKAYDFDTNLRPGDAAQPGAFFLNKIVRARTIGKIENGEPLTGGLGDPGLADPMAAMKNNFAVLKTQLGFNNAQLDVKEFSLRSQLLRIQNGSAGNPRWREQLTRYIVPNLMDVPEFRRHCLFEATLAKEPGLVIPFSSTIDQNLNFFAWPADAAGDSGFNPTAFSTKIRAIRVNFSNYRIAGGAGLREDPRVYLIPVGSDIMRAPRINPLDSINYTREWKIQDQWLPVPIRITDKNDPRLAVGAFIPQYDVELLQGFGLPQMAEVRAHPSFEAYHDSRVGVNPEDPQFQSARLIGRSVWNTQWLLVIPAVNLLNDRDEAIQRFVNGSLVGGVRDGNGVSDIKIRFRAYAYSGR